MESANMQQEQTGHRPSSLAFWRRVRNWGYDAMGWDGMVWGFGLGQTVKVKPRPDHDKSGESAEPYKCYTQENIFPL